MNATIGQLRELVSQADKVDEARRLLPELERQAANELAMDKAAHEADILSEQFETRVASYQVKLSAMRSKLMVIFGELDSLKTELDSLAVESRQVADSAYTLADKRTRAGFYVELARRMNLSRYDADFVRGQAGEIIKQKFGQTELLFGYHLAGNESDLVSWLLSALSQVSGLKVVKPNQPVVLPMPETYQPGRNR